MQDNLLTVKQVAEMFGVSEPTVWRHARHGLIPRPVRLGSATRWSASELSEAMDQLKANRGEAA